MKAILMVDMPIACDMCWLSVLKQKGIYCRHEGKYNFEHARPSWCPLKPMPSKKETVRDEPYSIEDYRIGWNACLEELEK